MTQCCAVTERRHGDLIRPHVRDSRCDSDVALELLPIDALMYEDGNFLAKFGGYPGFHTIVFWLTA